MTPGESKAKFDIWSLKLHASADRMTAWEGWRAALRSQGNAADISADRNWIAGAQWGFDRGLENDNASLAQALEARRRDIREAKSLTAIIGEGD
jgi:hypothetical protein